MVALFTELKITPRIANHTSTQISKTQPSTRKTSRDMPRGYNGVRLAKKHISTVYQKSGLNAQNSGSLL